MGIYSASTEGKEALAAGVVETLLHLVGSATSRAKVIEWGVSFDGASPTATPAVVRVIRTTADDGTSGGAAVEAPWDPADPAATCVVKHSFTAEPTKAAQPLAVYAVHPQAGIVIQYPLGREPILAADATDGFAIDCDAPGGVNAIAYIVWEE